MIQVLSAGSTLYGLRPCAEIFAHDWGTPVDVATDHGHRIHHAVLRGEVDADVVVLPSDMIAALVAAGLADAETVTAIGSVRIGAAVRADAPRPDVSTLPTLRQALAATDAVLLTLAPTGDHLMQVIARLGLTDTIAGRLQRFATSTLLNRHLVDNAAPGAIGFGPATEIKSWHDKGVAYAGAIPNEIQVVLPYSAAMLTRAPAREQARALLAFLAAAEARRHFIASGVE